MFWVALALGILLGIVLACVGAWCFNLLDKVTRHLTEVHSQLVVQFTDIKKLREDIKDFKEHITSKVDKIDKTIYHCLKEKKTIPETPKGIGEDRAI
jgi:uncharacterized protein YoxC